MGKNRVTWHLNASRKMLSEFDRRKIAEAIMSGQMKGTIQHRKRSTHKALRARIKDTLKTLEQAGIKLDLQENKIESLIRLSAKNDSKEY